MLFRTHQSRPLQPDDFHRFRVTNHPPIAEFIGEQAALLPEHHGPVVIVEQTQQRRRTRGLAANNQQRRSIVWSTSKSTSNLFEYTPDLRGVALVEKPPNRINDSIVHELRC